MDILGYVAAAGLIHLGADSAAPDPNSPVI
jgi:hypothetical protein